jgi:hypothetical protein
VIHKHASRNGAVEMSVAEMGACPPHMYTLLASHKLLLLTAVTAT